MQPMQSIRIAHAIQPVQMYIYNSINIISVVNIIHQTTLPGFHFLKLVPVNSLMLDNLATPTFAFQFSHTHTKQLFINKNLEYEGKNVEIL